MKSRSLARAGRMARLAALLLPLAATAALAVDPPPPPPPVPVPPLPDTVGAPLLYIRDVIVGRSECATCPPVNCPDKPVLVTVRGGFPSSCYALRSLRVEPTLGTIPRVVADIVVDTCARACSLVPVGFEASVELPAVPPGQYLLDVKERARRCPDTTQVSAVLGRLVPYEVLNECAAPPPPPIPADSLVRTFVRLAIVPEHPCAGDSVTLQLVKNGCPPCFHLVSFGNAVGSPAFEGVAQWTPVCNERTCIPETLSAPMGRLAAGSFNVSAPMTVIVHRLPAPDTTIQFRLPLQFQVSGDCPAPPGPCVVRQLESDVPAVRCALTLAPGGHGVVPLYYSSDLAMAGVQGTIQVPAPFQLTDLQLASGLTGVHLSLQKDGRGVRWLVFSDPGVTLPIGPHEHLLDASMAADPGALGGTSGLLNAALTLAVGPDGNELPLCIRQTLVVVAVRLCVAGEPSVCDVNHDGRLDVRDLVRMAGCLRHDIVDTTGSCVDCDSSGVFDLDDIFCCARAILRGPPVPPDSVRQDGDVSVSLGPVWEQGANRVVHVHVTGANALGATMLQLDYPADRWRADIPVQLAATTRPVDVDWYPLLDLDDPGHVHLGAIRLGDSGANDFDVEIVMEPTATPLPGDQLVVVGADLAGRDGGVLTPTDPLPAVSLTAPAPPQPGPGQPQALALSPPRPNPFTTRTTFVITLPASSQIDLAVHDLAGRRVATIASGLYASGQQTFLWDGAGMRGGIYYVRLRVNGQVLSTRVALLRNAH